MQQPAVPRSGRQVRFSKKAIDNSAAVSSSKVEKKASAKKKETRLKKSANADWPREMDLES